MTTTAARVEVLTAEVRILQVGSRQITLSVARQLDQADPGDIEPFGRIRTGARNPNSATDIVEVIGAARDGTLVRSTAAVMRYYCSSSYHEGTWISGWKVRRCADYPADYQPAAECWRGHYWLDEPGEWELWQALPLIVLAGLR